MTVAGSASIKAETDGTVSAIGAVSTEGTVSTEGAEPTVGAVSTVGDVMVVMIVLAGAIVVASGRVGVAFCCDDGLVLDMMTMMATEGAAPGGDSTDEKDS